MILFVDDERQNNLEYMEELKFAGKKVEFRKDVAVAFNFLIEHLQEIELLILDIMMPPGDLINENDANGGMRTGVRFYEVVRQMAPELPILILTNVSAHEVQERFDGEYRCWYIRKEKCLPYELSNEVKGILSEISSHASSQSK